MVKFSSLFLLERDERAFSVLVERTRVFLVFRRERDIYLLS